MTTVWSAVVLNVTINGIPHPSEEEQGGKKILTLTVND